LRSDPVGRSWEGAMSHGDLLGVLLVGLGLIMASALLLVPL
jgi:hypothetical protein